MSRSGQPVPRRQKTPEKEKKLWLTARFKIWYLGQSEFVQHALDFVFCFGPIVIVLLFLFTPLSTWVGEIIMEPFYLRQYGAIYKNFFVRIFIRYAAPYLVGAWFCILFVYSLYFYPRGIASIKDRLGPLPAIIWCCLTALICSIFPRLDMDRYNMDMEYVKSGAVKQIVSADYAASVNHWSSRSGGRTISNTFHFVYFVNELDGETIRLDIRDAKLFRKFQKNLVQRASIAYLPNTQTLLEVQLEELPPPE